MTSFFSKMLSSSQVESPTHSQIQNLTQEKETSLLKIPDEFVPQTASSTSSASHTLGTFEELQKPSNKRPRPSSPTIPQSQLHPSSSSSRNGSMRSHQPSNSQSRPYSLTESVYSETSPPPPSRSRQRYQSATPIPPSPLTSQLITSITNTIHSQESTISALASRVEELQAVIPRLANLEEYADSLPYPEIMERVEQNVQELDQKFETVGKDLGTRIDSIEKNLGKRIDSIRDDVNGLKVIIQDGFAAITASMTSRVLRNSEWKCQMDCDNRNGVREQSAGVSVFGDIIHTEEVDVENDLSAERPELQIRDNPILASGVEPESSLRTSTLAWQMAVRNGINPKDLMRARPIQRQAADVTVHQPIVEERQSIAADSELPPVHIDDLEDHSVDNSPSVPPSKETARNLSEASKSRSKPNVASQRDQESSQADSDIIPLDADQEIIPAGKRPRRSLNKVDYRVPSLVKLKQEAEKKVQKSPGKKQIKETVKKGGRKRTFYGKVLLTTTPLSMSDGQRRGTGFWPDKSKNTVKGNMQEITCEACKGRVHWACAGFTDDADPPNQWDCPDCERKMKEGTPRKLIQVAPQDKCIRYNCIRRDKQKIITQDGDEDEYYVEKFVGRRAIRRKENSTERVFEYLVKWLGWPMDDCTWEPEDNFIHCPTWRDQFLQECEELNLVTKKRVTMLPDTRKYWDPITGDQIGGEDEEDDDGSENAVNGPSGKKDDPVEIDTQDDV